MNKNNTLDKKPVRREHPIRNQAQKCSRWTGLGVHDGPELVFTMGRKMQEHHRLLKKMLSTILASVAK